MPFEGGIKNMPILSEIICVDIHESLKEHVLKRHLSSIKKDFLFTSFIKFKESTLGNTHEKF